MKDEIDILGVTYTKLPTLDGKGYFYAPKNPAPDDKDFPVVGQYQDWFSIVREGISRHEVERTYLSKDEWANTDPINGHFPLVAQELNIFSEFDWSFDCLSVLKEHGWINADAKPAASIRDRVLNKLPQAVRLEIESAEPENFDSYVLQMAARDMATPFSRLWYVCNLMALYYYWQDDIRFGYLLAEYDIRMRHGRDAARGLKSIESAKEGGAKRAATLSSATAEILLKMEGYIRDEMSVSNAARLSAQAGLGASKEANRKLWTRHSRK